MKEHVSYAGHADQLMAQGLRQMGVGVATTVSSELGTVIPGSIIGAALGVGRSVWHNSEILPAMIIGARDGAVAGVFVGWETAAQDYNAVAGREGLPRTQWYDWLVANFLMFGIAMHDKNNLGAFRMVRTALIAQGLNTITISGARHVLEGFINKIVK